MSTEIDQIRTICLAYPEATEKQTWESATFRIREKIFTMTSLTNREPEIWVKGRPGLQEMLCGADPQQFFRPPYLGPKGWIGIRLTATTDWDEVKELIDESYRQIAPKKLVAQLS